MTERRYRTTVDFKKALEQRLKVAAAAQNVPINDLRQRYVLECFLARVFAQGGDRWVLKGGTGLAVRIPGARHSRDLDLCWLSSDTVDDCVAQIEAAGAAGDRDPFVFAVMSHEPGVGGTALLRVKINVLLGARSFEQFPIDVAIRLSFTGPIDTLNRPLPVDMDDVAEPPPLRLYPMVDQVADKVAAMYEVHQGRPSSRYRDLVDLVLIHLHTSIDQELLSEALHHQRVVRRLVLPAELRSPGPGWEMGYKAEASRARAIPRELTDLTSALAFVQAALGAALADAAARHT